MTDPRLGEGLWAALERLPRGSGVVFRHYGLAAAERKLLFRKVAKVARKRKLILVAAGDELRGIGARNVHNGRRSLHGGLRTASAHSRREAIAAIRGGAELLFVSPVFATRSHPGARALGRVRFGMMVANLGVPIVALGGMDARRAQGLSGFDIHGWAGIDAWMRR
jgi:thiamine-phosphate pyrophosphorylase